MWILILTNIVHVWLRKRFFDHELVAFADIQNDEIKDMILIEKKQCEDLSYCNLLIFRGIKKHY